MAFILPAQRWYSLVVTTVNSGRRELLDAAAIEFSNLGFAGATTASIARRAKVTQPLVHHHFGSKKGLWDAVLEELFVSLQRALDDATRRSAELSHEERLRELLRAYIRFVGANPSLPRLLKAEGRGKMFTHVYKRFLSPVVAFFHSLIEKAVKGKAVRPIDSTMLFFVIVGAGSEPFSQPALADAMGLDTTKTGFVDTYAELVCEVVFGGLTRRS